MRAPEATLFACLAACGATSVQPAADGGPGGTDTQERAGFGEDCAEDSDCTSGICWDFADVDPYCAGKVCSVACSTDKACQGLASAAGAPAPSAADCSDDECNLVGTGLGSFVCE